MCFVHIDKLAPEERRLFQEVYINPWFTVRNHDRPNRSFIKIHRPRVSDDGIYITKLAQAPQARNQERRADAAASFIFGYAGRAKEGFARTLVSGKTNHPPRARGDDDRYRLIGNPTEISSAQVREKFCSMNSRTAVISNG